MYAHMRMHTERNPHTKPWAKKENGLLCWQQLFPNPRPWAILCSQAGYYMATIRGAGAQHLVVSYSGPSVAADCTVSQPGGPPSMTLASHSRVNQEPAIIQWACIDPIQTGSFSGEKGWWRQCYKNLFNWRSQTESPDNQNELGGGVRASWIRGLSSVDCLDWLKRS